MVEREGKCVFLALNQSPLPPTLSPYSMIVPIKQNGDRDIIGKLNEAIKVMGKEEEKEESFSEGH